jgi:hypothetical protein
MRFSRWFHDDLRVDRYLERYFRNLAERRITAVALACQLFRIDHAHWPERLEQLVPDYLTAIPLDPYHSDGRPTGYVVLKGKLPDGGDRALVYYDAGDAEAPIPDEPMYRWQYDERFGHGSDAIRQYRDLARFVPAKK